MKILLLLISLLLVVGFRESEKLKLPLSKIDEKKHLNDFCKNGDIKAREVLIERNLRLVVNIAKKYVNTRNDLEDLMSIGTIGLIKGIDTFKNENGNKLSTYISKCIENEILMHFRKEKKTNEDIYLEEVKCQDKDGNGIRIIDLIESVDENVEDKVYDKLNFELVKGEFDKALNEVEQVIIRKRYGIFGCQRDTQENIAKELGISRSYVSRLEKSALIKLKKVLKKNNMGQRTPGKYR